MPSDIGNQEETMKLQNPCRLAARVARAGLLALAFGIIAGVPTDLFAQNGFKIFYNFGLERGDYKDFDLQQPVWEYCRDACAAEAKCLSFTYTIPIAGPNGRPAHCWLKDVVPRGEGRDWCISGVKENASGCGGGTGYFISAPNYAATGTRIRVAIGTRGAKTTSQGEWIGLMKAGTNDYVEWTWVKDIQGCELTFGAPARGNYEFRYFMDGGYDKVAYRSPITIQ